eukprot:6207376-Pleurochrysis_carterae.AAC.4
MQLLRTDGSIEGASTTICALHIETMAHIWDMDQTAGRHTDGGFRRGGDAEEKVLHDPKAHLSRDLWHDDAGKYVPGQQRALLAAAQCGDVCLLRYAEMITVGDWLPDIYR